MRKAQAEIIAANRFDAKALMTLRIRGIQEIGSEEITFDSGTMVSLFLFDIN